MCNLYSLTKGQSAIRDLFAVRHDRTGNLPSYPGIFPDQMAPLVRVGEGGERELVMARWGMPGAPEHGSRPVTNIRNVMSPHWRRWLGQASRCVVPATSFCEYADTKPKKTPTWFALNPSRPLFAFAGALDALDGNARLKERAGRGRARALRFSDHQAQHGGRADPSASHARHFDDAGRGSPLAPGGRPEGAGAAAPAAGRPVAHCRDRRERGPGPQPRGLTPRKGADGNASSIFSRARHRRRDDRRHRKAVRPAGARLGSQGRDPLFARRLGRQSGRMARGLRSRRRPRRLRRSGRR